MTPRPIAVVIPAVALAFALAACGTATDQQADGGLNAVSGDAPYTHLPGSPYPVLSYEDREAIGRVTYAEAGNQGEEGIAAVIFTILNRVNSGQFGASAQDVVDARNQFEPATRAGGWRYLPRLDSWQSVQFETILNLILAGRLPDLTGGALFFQNAAIVARRAARGKASSYLVDFGGTPPVAEIGDHRFYDWRAAENLAAWRNRAYDAVTAYSPDAAYSTEATYSSDAAYSTGATGYASGTDATVAAGVVSDEALSPSDPVDAYASGYASGPDGAVDAVVAADVVPEGALSASEFSAAAWEEPQSASTITDAAGAGPADTQCRTGYC